MRIFKESNVDVEQNIQDKRVIKSKVANYSKLQWIAP